MRARCPEFSTLRPMVNVIRSSTCSLSRRCTCASIHYLQQLIKTWGIPTATSTDRLVKVSMCVGDSAIAGPIELVRPKVMYAFADPTLEARRPSKLLIRNGAG